MLLPISLLDLKRRILFKQSRLIVIGRLRTPQRPLQFLGIFLQSGMDILQDIADHKLHGNRKKLLNPELHEKNSK